MSDGATTAGIIGMASQHLEVVSAALVVAGGLVGAFYLGKYRVYHAQREAIESWKAVAEARENEIEEIKHRFGEQIDSLQKQVYHLTERIKEISERLDTVNRENSALRTKIINDDLTIGDLRRTLVYIRDNCPQECKISKTVNDVIARELAKNGLGYDGPVPVPTLSDQKTPVGF